MMDPVELLVQPVLEDGSETREGTSGIVTHHINSFLYEILKELYFGNLIECPRYY